MASINKVILIGNVGKDPECKLTPNGVLIANFTLATSENVKKNDEWEQKTDWHNITCFTKTAEYVEKSIKKGSNIYLEGKIEYQSWADESGAKKYKTVIIANIIKGLEKAVKKDNGDSEQESNVIDLPF
jgi:single-strand DNA-binding protein